MHRQFKAVLLMFGLMLLLSIPSMMLVGQEVVNQKRHIIADLFVIADIIATNSSSGIVFAEPETVNNILNTLNAQSDISHAYVFSEQNLFASYSRDNDMSAEITLQSLLPVGISLDDIAHQETLQFSDRTYITIFKQINLTTDEGEENNLGVIVMKYEMQSLQDRVKAIRTTLFFDVLLSLIVAFIVVCRYVYAPFCNFRPQAKSSKQQD